MEVGLLDGDGHLPGLGRNGNLENVAKRFVSVFSKQCLLHVPCLGAGHGLKMRAVRGRMQTLPGSQDLSERGLGVEERADEAISTSSRVRGTLALGDVCQSACLHCTKERHEVWGGDAGD